MKIAMFSWETLRFHAVGGIAAHVTELAAALQRRGHEVHVFTRPGYGSGGVCRIDGVWYHYCPHNLSHSFVDEIQKMCRSFAWHFIQTEDYLARHGAHGRVQVRTGAWNTGWHNGQNFVQWTGSQAQKDALERVAATSQTLHRLRHRAGDTGLQTSQGCPQLEEAQWRVLRAETSCNFFWGEAWLHRCYHDLDKAWQP